MKNIVFAIITLATVAAITVSCNQTSNKNNDQQATDSIAAPESQNFVSSNAK